MINPSTPAPKTIDLVAENGQDLNDLRTVLLRPDRDLIAQQREQLERQQGEIAILTSRLEQLERLMIDTTGRTEAVDEVLLDVVRGSRHGAGELGQALQPEIEHAVFSSARTDGSMLADALYPVIGPAIRKSVAALFSLDKDQSGKAFSVEQIILIERTTGLMLASTATDEKSLDDADVVSGMIDALTTFVQEAFEASSDDGLQDLRVGDLSLLVETGPHAVLASVIRGIPTQEYRDGAAATLEAVHLSHGKELAAFDGSLEPFEGVSDSLGDLHSGAVAGGTQTSPWSLFGFVVVATLVVLLIVAAIV